MLFETESGTLVDVETNVNIRYGYDIRGEIVGEQGPLPWPNRRRPSSGRAGTFSGRVPQDWRERFIRAYDIEFQEWIDAIAGGGNSAPARGTGTPPPRLRCRRAGPARRSPRPVTKLIDKPPSTADRPARSDSAPREALQEGRHVGTVRLTVAQALVRFLCQSIQRAGRRRTTADTRVASASSGTATWPVSGKHCCRPPHGPADLPYYLARNEQGMVHAAAGLRQDPQPAADVGLHGVHRARRRRTC